MTIATLVKITPARKLMMKISDKTYGMITARLTGECKKKNFPTDRLATFTLEDDQGEENYFMMISLDKYDKQNMPMFERLLRKEVAIQYRLKPYDFIPDGEEEQRCGINLELISIRAIKQQPVNEIDEIADKAAARACCRLSACLPLNAEEQAIDEDVEKAAAKYVAKKVQKDELPLAPPVLERQMATAATHRRRRVEPSEEMATGVPVAALAAADYQTPEEIKAFAVIDAFEQEE